MNASEPIAVDRRYPPLSQSARRARWWNGFTAGLLCGAALSCGYLVWFWRSPPSPASGIGLALGASGLLLMLGAETLYSFRKRSRRFTYGKLSAWLQMHIFMGIVGACLILLHSSGKFQGLAGAAVAVMLVAIISGVVGRFLYTAAPRTLDGIELDVREMLARFAAAEHQRQLLGIRLLPRELAKLSLNPALPDWALVLGRKWLLWRQRRRARRYARRHSTIPASVARQWQRLLVDRFEFQLDLRAATAARRWLSWWHVLHVPLGLVLFSLATIHIVVALRYLLG